MNRERIFGPGGALPSPSTQGEDGQPRTALPVYQGVPRHLEAHLLRLQAGALALGKALDWLPSLQADIVPWVKGAIPNEDGALRMILHLDLGLMSARLEPLPQAPAPYLLVPLPHPMGARRSDPLLIHKGLSGPWWRDVLEQAHQLGAEDALLLWPGDTLAETAIAAVGIELDGLLMMPPPQGRVASLAERLDLPGWAVGRGLRIEQRDLSLPLAREGRVWCMNALRGIWPATLL